jgi:hypothetical protein
MPAGWRSNSSFMVVLQCLQRMPPIHVHDWWIMEGRESCGIVCSRLSWQKALCNSARATLQGLYWSGTGDSSISYEQKAFKAYLQSFASWKYI